jgi:hypothetical protein
MGGCCSSPAADAALQQEQEEQDATGEDCSAAAARGVLRVKLRKYSHHKAVKPIHKRAEGMQVNVGRAQHVVEGGRGLLHQGCWASRGGASQLARLAAPG